MIAALPFPDISPELFSVSVFGIELALRWYALAYIAGLILGVVIIGRLMRAPGLWPDNRAPMTAEQVESLLTWIVVGVILGGRLGYVLFYRPDYYMAHPQEILQLWTGGMAFHGGLLGVMVAIILFARRNALPLLSCADALAVAAPTGLLFGRLANFINAELWGRPTEAPWGVVFPTEAAQYCPGWDQFPCARHPSQLYEAALEGLLLGLIIYALVLGAKALRRPGTVAGVFFVGYGLSRFIVELVRQPDAQFASADNPVGYALQLGQAGLTMGQILSLPMIAFGVGLILYAKGRR